ncbi:MAG: adenylate/guanylate cyclase domain-containing protein [Gaiellaceae bacterium]
MSETQYAKSGDLRIAYQVHGGGPIDLLFAPGYLSHLEQNQWWPKYAAFFEKLASFSRLIVFDRRGTGLSDRILALGSFEELMDDIGVVLDAVGSERAALFGGAEGGPMCALFAATFPERTSALVLGASYARRRWAPDYPWGLDEDAQKRILDGYEERWGRIGFGARAIAPTLADDERFQVWYAQAQRFSGTPASAREWFRITMEIDIREVLPAIRVPTLVIHRSGDRVIPVESGRYLAEHIPDAKFVELPGQDHFPFVGDMDALLDEVEEFLTGSRRAREPDRVLATVLFTDIVGSTERAAELGDRRWTELLAEHHRVVSAELERHRGKVVRIEGDGTLSTFDGPARAVNCATAIQRALASLGVEIRAGLHTGEIELAETGVEGIAVHIGARVAALAEPGELLTSSTVKDLVVGSGIEFGDRGTHVLKGVPGEWQVYAVGGAGSAG